MFKKYFVLKSREKRTSSYRGRLTDYITREDAIKALCKSICYRGVLCPDEYCKEVREPFDDIPAADVVQVIRCKDCKHNPKITWFGCPLAHCSETQRPETAWCWKAERREG